VNTDRNGAWPGPDTPSLQLKINPLDIAVWRLPAGF